MFDVLILGSGASGLGLALSLADQHTIAIICKDDLLTSSSQRAQGGIAAVLSDDDSYVSHIKDTLNAGAGLCDPIVVEATVTAAKTAISRLIKRGVKFTTQTNHTTQPYHLTQEGGHSHRRIIHAADKTGAAVVNTLADQVLAHPNIHCFSKHTVIDLQKQANTVTGARVLNNRDNSIKTLSAHCTVLATGGASMNYLHTSNPSQTTGDGIAIAFTAGARVANMEFNQFHPTCFYHPDGRTFLITESMRGEGAKLILPTGEAFMQNYDPRAELAPRDIVSRAIDNELKTKNLSHVLLDISHQPKEKILTLFPTIATLCREQNIDITRSPIPIVPAAHYTCGGVITNLQGETDLEGLYAIGEVACTGLHGANRMASNSLLECLVFASNAAKSIQQRLTHCHSSHTTAKTTSITGTPLDNNRITKLTQELRQLMWDKVGIVRSNQRLQLALQQIQHLEQQCQILFTQHAINKPLLELRNMITTAKITVLCAQHRQESRGVHYNLDYPQRLTEARNSIAIPCNHGHGIHIETSHDIHSLIQPTIIKL